MAGRRSIGELVAVISADAHHFNKAIDDSEKRLTALAKTAAAPAKFGAEFAAGIGGLAGGPLVAALRPIQELVEMLPGMHAYAALLSPKGAAQKVNEISERTLENAREAARVGLDPQFLAGLRVAAGADAQATEDAIGKILINLGNLKAGVGDARENVTAMEKWKRWGFDLEEVFKAGPEEALLAVMRKFKELEGSGKELAMLKDLGGRGAIGAATFFQSGEKALEHYVELVKEHNLHAPTMIAYAKELQKLHKELGIHTQAAAGELFTGGGGTVALGINQWQAGQSRNAVRNLLGPFFNVANAGIRNFSLLGLLGVFPKAEYRPEELLEAQRRAAAKVLKDEMTGEKNKAGPSLAEINKQLEVMDAEKALGKINETLDDQEKLLRYTEDGWKGFEQQLLAIDKALTKSGGTPEALAKANEAIGKLGEMRFKKEQEQEKKDQEAWEKRIEERLGHIKSERFAPTALAGSAEAAAAVNAMFTTPTGLTLSASVDQIVKMMQQNKFDEQTKQNIREAAQKLRKIDDKLDPLGPVD